MGDQVNTIKLSVTSSTQNVSYVVKKLEDFCIQANIEKKISETIIIATDEAITNIILHAYHGKNDGLINIQFTISDNKIIIELSDYGKIFETFEQKKKSGRQSVGQLHVGGYGLVLMESLMDEVLFVYDDKLKSNNLKMIKYLENREA